VTRDEADDIKRHFDVVAERLEGQIRQVAEGVVLNGERLDKVDQRLDKVEQHFDRFETEVRSEFAQVREREDRFEREVRTEFGEVKSMIKLSYTELDRRLSTLEHTVEDLSLRVGHLEAHRSS
jgi:hypothetical protein